MSDTWSTRLAGDRKRIALWFTIQGIETVFKERDIDASTILGETRNELVCIPVGGIEEGETTIDLLKRASIGGSLKVTLVERFGDTTLADLFQHLKRRRSSTSAVTKTATTINSDDATWASSPGTLYIGAETVTYTGTASGPQRFTGVTRAKWGSRAQAFKGTTSAFAGAAIYDVPPAWIGRRITLYGSFIKDDGTTNSSLTTTLGTFTIDTPPRLVDSNKWEISCGPLSDEYAQRKCYVGQKEVKSGVLYISGGGDLVAQVGDDGTKFDVSASSFSSYALVKIKGDDTAPLPKRFTRAIIAEIISNDVVSDPHLVTLRNVGGAGGFFLPPVNVNELPINQGAETAGWPTESVQHIALIGGPLGGSILRALLSDLGDGDNGSHDVLPARDRTSSDIASDGWRMGAAIDEDDVDEDSFTNQTGRTWMYVLDQTVTVGDLLKEWAFAFDSFWYVTPAGVLTAASMSDVAGATTMTINSSVTIPTSPPQVYVEEDSIFPIVSLKANYSPVSHEYLLTVLTPDAELLQRYPQREEVLDLWFKGLGVDTGRGEFPQTFQRPGTKTVTEVQNMARSWQLAEGRGRLIVKVKCRLKALLASIGSTVTIGFEATDFQGGSINGRTARVIGRRPNYDQGFVDLTLQVLETMYVFAPSAVVTALSTTSIANDTLTLSTTSPDASGTSPENDFPVGAIVRLWDVSAGTSQTLTVAAIVAGHKLRFTTGVTGAIEANRDWLTWSTLGVNTGLTSTSGYDEPDLAYMMSDTGTPASGSVRRWR